MSDTPAILVLGAFHSGGGQTSLHDAENAVDFQDLVSYIHGKHTFRFGAIVKSRLIDFSDSSNFGGTFTFSDLAAFTSKQPQPFQFTAKQGDPRVSFNQHEFAYFFQDEMRFWGCATNCSPTWTTITTWRHGWRWPTPRPMAGRCCARAPAFSTSVSL